MKARHNQKVGATNSTLILSALTSACLLLFAPTLRAQLSLTPAQAAALTPAPPSVMANCHAWYSLSFPEDPCLPANPHPGLPAYLLPDGFSCLLDDTSILYPPRGAYIDPVAAARSFLAQEYLDAQRQASLNSLSDGPPPLPDPTNAPPSYTPPPPELLAPGSFPTNNGAYYLLTETNGAPYAYDMCPGVDVWLLYD